jgi:Methyltransferase domain
MINPTHKAMMTIFTYFFTTVHGFSTTTRTSSLYKVQQSITEMMRGNKNRIYNNNHNHHIRIISCFPYQRPFITKSVSISSSRLYSNAWDLLEGDFSSAVLWDRYYSDNPIESSTLEWHKSIPLDVIAQYCFNNFNFTDVAIAAAAVDNHINAAAAAADYDLVHDSTCTCRCLMVGCGTSFLPERVLALSDNTNKKIHITLLDSSPSCIDSVRRRYEGSNTELQQLSFVTGSALELENLLDTTENRYDVVLDKGLMDAFFCNDDWENAVTTLLTQSMLVMKSSTSSSIDKDDHHSSSTTSGYSRYVLVSYRLSSTTQRTLQNIGRMIGLSWTFNCTGSNDRVWISVGVKTT